MTLTETVQGLRNRISKHSGPALSAYVNVNPARPENQEKAYVNRLKAALKGRRAPGDFSESTLESFHAEPPHTKTIAYFASPMDFWRLAG